jgi:hypothetical protein
MGFLWFNGAIAAKTINNRRPTCQFHVNVVTHFFNMMWYDHHMLSMLSQKVLVCWSINDDLIRRLCNVCSKNIVVKWSGACLLLFPLTHGVTLSAVKYLKNLLTKMSTYRFIWRLFIRLTKPLHIGCSFEFPVKVGVEQSLVNAPLV